MYKICKPVAVVTVLPCSVQSPEDILALTDQSMVELLDEEAVEILEVSMVEEID